MRAPIWDGCKFDGENPDFSRKLAIIGESTSVRGASDRMDCCEREGDPAPDEITDSEVSISARLRDLGYHAHLEIFLFRTLGIQVKYLLEYPKFCDRMKLYFSWAVKMVRRLENWTHEDLTRRRAICSVVNIVQSWQFSGADSRQGDSRDEEAKLRYGGIATKNP